MLRPWFPIGVELINCSADSNALKSSMLSDFFIATPAEVQEVDIARGPSTSTQCLRAKRTDPVKLVQLQCCIEGVPFEERLPLIDQMFVRNAGDDGPWICRLPDVLQRRLASASPSVT